MPVDPARLRRCYEISRDALLAERNDAGHWTGELSTSALSTATAVMALELMRSAEGERPNEGAPLQLSTLNSQLSTPAPLTSIIHNGVRWLAEHQNDDGGWGDTTKSISNISTSMLCRASFHATGNDAIFPDVVRKAVAYIDRVGGVDAVLKRYGKDRTFSIPILTHCALAGLVDWKDVLPLPFYLACLPAKAYKTVRLPVVSYALPALIAIGQVGFHFRKPWNPISRFLKHLAIEPSLRVLERIQPSNGGFLEAAPLTSFVTMSLAGMGRGDHPVAQKGLQFLIDSVRPDGSWPIDTNLATWVTTLSVNALGDDLPEPDRPAIRDWLLQQQYKEIHPYTNADPGGWAWTDLPGGVPDADDTPGAMLALMQLASNEQASRERQRPEVGDRRSEVGGPTSVGSERAPCANCDSATRYSVLSTQYPVPSTEPSVDPSLEPCLDPSLAATLTNAVRWLVGLQNRDGGFPTFCRGWAAMPFDRSSPDITAHCLRAIAGYLGGRDDEFVRSALAGEPFHVDEIETEPDLMFTWLVDRVLNGFRFLKKAQHPDGSWLPLWFGNQRAPDDINPVYGTARVLAGYRDCNRFDTPEARRGLEFLAGNQNPDGGWGGVRGTPSSVEETALAVEILLADDPQADFVQRGLQWLCERVEDGSWREPAPIGFYFARLWYFERLYPMIFTVAALRRACHAPQPSSHSETPAEESTRTTDR